MSSENNHRKSSYILLGIGDPGKYVLENILDSMGHKAFLSLHAFNKSSDFRVEEIEYSDQTRALFLVLQPGDGDSDKLLPGLESFTEKSGIPIYTIANYPFLWEGHIRINRAKSLLNDLTRISSATFSIESHQWFPLKEQLGFHRVVELVHELAFRILLTLLELQERDSDIRAMEYISIEENVEARQQQGGMWLVRRINLD